MQDVIADTAVNASVVKDAPPANATAEPVQGVEVSNGIAAAPAADATVVESFAQMLPLLQQLTPLLTAINTGQNIPFM